LKLHWSDRKSKLPVEGDGIIIFDLSNEELTTPSEHASPLPSSFKSLAADTAFTFKATPHPVISDPLTPVLSPTKKRA
jgi:hypothetical protein